MCPIEGKTYSCGSLCSPFVIVGVHVAGVSILPL